MPEARTGPPDAGSPVSASVGSGRACEHCGTPFLPRRDRDRFCCSGCRYVHDLLHEQGLERFYALKDRSVPPVQGRVFETPATDWVTDWLQRCEATAADRAEGELAIQGISCVGCVWVLEKTFHDQPGSLSLRVDAQRGRLVPGWRPGAFDLAAWVETVAQLGYRIVPAEQGTTQRNDDGLGLRIGLAGAFAANTMLFTLPRYLGMADTFFLADLFLLLSFAFATLGFATGGSYFIRRAWQALRHGVLHMDLPIALGLVGAYLGSLVGWLLRYEPLIYFDFVAVFAFLMLVGRWVQDRALDRQRSQVLDFDAFRRPVVRLPGPHAGDGDPVALDDVVSGNWIQIAPGAVVPVQAVQGPGSAEYSLEWIHGEGDPVLREQGQPVPAGAILLADGPVALQATERWSDSLVHALTRRESEPAATGPDPLSRYIRGYVAVVVLTALAGWAAWTLAGRPLAGFQAALSLLVVSCPCALGVAWPFLQELATGIARREAVFVREPDLWQRLGRVRHVLFDKTGTLTLDTPDLVDPETLESLDAEARAALRRLTHDNRHPVGRGIRSELVMRFGAGEVPAGTVVTEPGAGCRFRDGQGRVWSLGRPGWAAPAGVCPPDGGKAGEGTLFARDGKILAVFRISEALRSEAARVAGDLEGRGIRSWILSGDRQANVDRQAGVLGIPRDRALGDLRPEAKADRVRRLEAEAGTLMVGDGANDSLAFDAAACRGTPVLDGGLLDRKADFYFLGRGIGGLATLFTWADAYRRGLRSVFGFTLVYNLAAGAVCLAGWMHPLIAAILMPLSSLATLGLARLAFRQRCR